MTTGLGNAPGGASDTVESLTAWIDRQDWSADVKARAHARPVYGNPPTLAQWRRWAEAAES